MYIYVCVCVCVSTSACIFILHLLFKYCKESLSKSLVCWLIKRKARTRAPGKTSTQNT